jgi:hypothetical protein
VIKDNSSDLIGNTIVLLVIACGVFLAGYIIGEASNSEKGQVVLCKDKTDKRDF